MKWAPLFQRGWWNLEVSEVTWLHLRSKDRKSSISTEKQRHTSNQNALTCRDIWQWLFDHELYSDKMVGQLTGVLPDWYNRKKKSDSQKYDLNNHSGASQLLIQFPVLCQFTDPLIEGWILLRKKKCTIAKNIHLNKSSPSLFQKTYRHDYTLKKNKYSDFSEIAGFESMLIPIVPKCYTIPMKSGEEVYEWTTQNGHRLWKYWCSMWIPIKRYPQHERLY